MYIYIYMYMYMYIYTYICKHEPTFFHTCARKCFANRNAL